ncbi:response regulator with CheY-like receiver domain and winged-helix DNA-binding domain [Xenococcus sp. PCC 7305]|uniref:response regulator n=1 Tax=Xenococcus sp. PCC 7305 TaxID=102125 RepID=UPI0002ACA090|nr:response regulator [Xenococcus sp. PCC 7305]ELS02737.1 response regulator with CheY-like receiver domain and winged-helix DNA-binding domain [Xenococcus sp. PCC 7305]
MEQYQKNQLKSLLELQLESGINGVLKLETQVNSWQSQQTAVLVINNGCLVYGGSKIPNGQQFAKYLGDKLKPDLIDAALSFASKKLNNSQSVRELIELLVKLRVFSWENIETHIYKQIVLLLEKFNSHPGQAQWEDDDNFDLSFGADRHGLNWIRVKQDLSDRRQQWANLESIIPAMDAIPNVIERQLSTVQYTKIREQLKIYIDGRKTLSDIATEMDKDPLVLANHYSNLVKSGVISFDSHPANHNQANINQTITTGSPQKNLPTILSLDDSRIVQVSIKRALQGDYNVVLASNAAEALMYINRNSIDLLLLDVTMPDVNGWEFCRMIRKMPKFEELPIIMVTARDGLLDKMKGQISGTNKYLTKPFKKEELLEVISKYIKSSKRL